jgi:hypothetical protein
MKKTKKPIPVDPTTSVGQQLGAIASNIASMPTLSEKQRKTLGTRSRRAPDALIELVLKLAESNGGQVAGIPIDVASARTTLTNVSAASGAASASRRIAAQMDDDALQQRVVVADRAFGIHMALRRFVNTPEGIPFQRASEEMASIIRNQPRLKRGKAAEQPTSSTTEPATSQPAPTQSAPSQPATKPAATGTTAATPATNTSLN